MTKTALFALSALASEAGTRVTLAYAPSTTFVGRSRHVSSASCIGGAAIGRDRCRLSMNAGNDAIALPRNDTDAQPLLADASNAEPSSSGSRSLFMEVDLDNNSFGASTSSRSYGLPVNDNTQPAFQSTNSSPQQQSSSWKDRLIDISNIASFLCVLDCTLLPLVSIALPALSWIASGTSIGSTNNAILSGLSSIMDHVPALGHGIALFFVVPVGLLTTIVNYFFGHKQLKFSTSALFGVMLIYAANSNGIGISSIDSFLTSWGIASSHGHVHDTCGAIVGAMTNMHTHTCGEGWAHRLTNTIGCALLLGSNHYGKKYMEKQSKGCAASALAEAWGNDGGRRMVCPPGCGCERPYGASRVTNVQSGGEMFFSWDRAGGGDVRGKNQADSGVRNGGVRRFGP